MHNVAILLHCLYLQKVHNCKYEYSALILRIIILKHTVQLCWKSAYKSKMTVHTLIENSKPKLTRGESETCYLTILYEYLGEPFYSYKSV